MTPPICDGCGKRVTVAPWRFGSFVTHPNTRCAGAAERPALTEERRRDA